MNVMLSNEFFQVFLRNSFHPIVRELHLRLVAPTTMTVSSSLPDSILL